MDGRIVAMRDEEVIMTKAVNVGGVKAERTSGKAKPATLDKAKVREVLEGFVLPSAIGN